MDEDAAPIPFVTQHDPRIDTLKNALKALIYERAEAMGLPMATVFGIVEIVKLEIWDEQKE